MDKHPNPALAAAIRDHAPAMRLDALDASWDGARALWANWTRPGP